MGSPGELGQSGYNIHQHTPTDSVKEISKEETAEVCKDHAESQWQPGFFRRFPIIGFASLLLCIGCTGAAIGIIRMTNNQPITDWSGRLKPEVLLSYTSTIANALMGFAFAEAAVIGFWNNALDAMPASNLHYYWAGSSSALGAIRSIFHRRAVLVSSVAILVTVSSLLRGPLIQRASFVVLVSNTYADTKVLSIMPNITDGWVGISRFSPGFADVVNDFQYQNPIEIGDQTCDSCTLNATAFGFALRNCSTVKIPYNLTLDEVKKAEDPFDFYIFNSDVFIVKDEALNTSALHINLTRKLDTGLLGEMEHQSCFLYPAVVNYSLSLDLDGFLQFQNFSWKSDTVVSLLRLNQVDILDTISTNLYQSASLARFTGNPGRWTMDNVGFLSNIYFATDPGFQSSEEPEHLMYNDPMDDLINSFRDLALRMSVKEAQEKNDGKLFTELVVAQNVSYVSNTTRAEYATDEDALALGVVVSLIGPVATLVLFWGFWRLGRKVTMSPLEVINAMSVSPATAAAHNGTEVAGIFADCKSNVEGATVADYVRSKETAGSGEPKLQYGVVEETGRLGMVVVNGVLPERRRVRRPMKGEVL